MSNFDIFNPAKLAALIEPFASGMSPHITPIKYEAITPDIFALLFRTTGRDGSEHYFVSLEFDYIKSLEAATEIIEKWHGHVIDIWPQGGADEEANLRAQVSDTYSALFAEVERPKESGYWAEYVAVRNEAEIEDALVDVPAKYQDTVRKGLKEIFATHPNVAIHFYIDNDGAVDYVYQ